MQRKNICCAGYVAKTSVVRRVIDRIQHGQGRDGDLNLLNSVADNIQGRTICALGDAAAMPVRAMIKHFRPEFEALIRKDTPQASASA